MTKEPFIAHSEMTNEIYIVCGTEKYPVTEQVIKAMKSTGRLAQSTSEDCVSRKEVFETIDDCNSDGLKGIFCSYDDGERFKEYIKKLPPVTPTHDTCKDCKKYRNSLEHCTQWVMPTNDDFYCADFERKK